MARRNSSKLLPLLLLLLAAATLWAGCSSPCEVVCTRLAECNLLAGDLVTCTTESCPEQLADDDRQACASCLDTVSCADLPSCTGPSQPCPLVLIPASP